MAGQLRHRGQDRRGGHRLLRRRAHPPPAGRRRGGVEVDRPNRQNRRRRGKRDPVDALAAARAALSGDASGQAKTRNGAVEAIRVLRVARTSAPPRPHPGPQPDAQPGVHAPDELREQLRDLTGAQLIDTCAALRPGRELTVLAATRTALRELARRARSLGEQMDRVTAQIGAPW